MAKSKDEDIRIFELPEATSLPTGMYVAVDNETLGTKKYNISEALDSMATSADVEEIREELESKADTDALSSYYTKTETDDGFVSKIGYVATDNNYTTPEKEQLAGLTPIRRLGDSASVIGQYNVLKVHVTKASYFYVDLDAQTPGGYPTPSTIKLCVFTPVSPLEYGARSACKFSALILGNRAEYGNILPYPVLFVKQNTSTDYIVYVILKVKNDSSVTDYSIDAMPSVRWTIWRDEQYSAVGQHLDYQFMLGVASDPDYSGSTMMEWDQVNFVDAANITNVKPDWNAAAGTAAEILNKPTIPTASTLAGDGLEEASGKLKVVTKVPDPGDNEHRGQVLTVGNSDEVSWAYSDAAVVIIESTLTTAEKNAKFDKIRSEGKIPAFWYNATKESVTRNVLCEWKYDSNNEHVFMGSSIISPDSSLNGHPRVFWVTVGVNANWGTGASFVGLTEVPQSNYSNNGQVLMVDGTNPAWMPLPKELPPSSAQLSGRVLTVDSTGNPAWAVVPTELPSSTSTDEGKVLTVGSNGGPGWDYPEDELPSYNSQTLVGTYLSVCSGSNNNELRWEEVSAGRGLSTRQDTYQGHSTKVIEVDSRFVIPPYSIANAGMVLAVNAAGTGLEWINPGSNVPANALGINGEPLGVSGEYVTVGE